MGDGGRDRDDPDGLDRAWRCGSVTAGPNWPGVLVVAAVIAVLLPGYGLVVLIQPWNPYLPLIAWIVVLLATWSVLCGDHMMLVPLVVAASFAAQTHIPYLLMAGGLGLFAVAVVLVRCWRSDDRRAFVRPAGLDRRSVRRCCGWRRWSSRSVTIRATSAS